MFNYNTFTQPNQNFSPVRAPASKPLQNVSPAYFPPSQANWNPASYFTPTHQPSQSNSGNHPGEDVPYGVRVLLDDEDPVSSAASSDSEETDTMPEVAPKIATSAVKEWDFGQDKDNRRKSETFLSNSPGVVKGLNSSNNSGISSQNKGWSPYPLGKVSTKPIFFSPLNQNDHVQSDKRAYFVTLEGFNISNSQRFFKIERLCHSLQAKGPYNDMANSRPFLHIGLWGDSQGSQDGSENIFEPWIFAIPYLQFRLVVTVNMSHAYEDPYTFEFLIDTRYLAIPTTDRRTQSIEVVYAEPGNNGSPGNTATIHLQVTNEKLAVPHGFKNFQDNQNNRQEMPLNYSIILRQIFIGVPLCRPENPYLASPLITQGMQRQPDPHGKRSSAISLGSQERRSSILENCPQSPMSWSNFTPDMSPAQKKVREKPKCANNKEDPEMPPGIPTNNPGAFETANYTNGPSLFKFKGQPRFSIQPIKRDAEEANAKRTNRIQSSDFSALLGEDKSPLKILEAYVNAVKNGNRRQSHLSENSSAIGRFQHSGSLAGTDNDPQTQSTSTLNASSFGEIVLDPAHLEEENLLKNGNNEVIEEFRAEDFVGKMAELVKTYQGSKILQKHISTADKEDLDLVVRELGEKIGDLLLDPYANYIIQTLMQNGSPSQRLYLLQKMAICFIPIARDKKGTHALQAIVAQINSPEEFALIKHIVGNSIFELSMDPRANYVIQKLINVIPIDSSQFIYQPLFDNFIQVANNSFGLLVLKQMMGRVEQKEVLKQRVVELTCINFEKLIQNPYGNYAIQHIMEFYPKESLLIMNKILIKIIPYSSQKISSNVIEKCLTVCDAQFRKRVVEEILKNGRLSDLLKNKYGNFVTLQLLATTSTSDKKKLMQEILRCANSFNGTKYKMRWLKFVQENPLKIAWNTEEQEKTTEISEVKESKEEEHSEDKDLEEEQAGQSQAETADNLEAVKRIWREMTKEEKTETPTFQYNNKSVGKKNFGKREDGF